MLKLGILGHPIGHTLSPLLHDFLMKNMAIEGEYLAYDVPPDELSTEIQELEEHQYRGLNITIPHKVAVIEYLTEIRPEAEIIGAVNTVHFKGKKRYGYNTDSTGFLNSLDASLRETLTEKSAIVLGAGGSSRAVLDALIQENTKQITVVARNPKRATETMRIGEKLISHHENDSRLAFMQWPEHFDLSDCHLLINTTPIGMSPDVEQSPCSSEAIATMPKGAWVYDLIYRPSLSTLLHYANAHQLKIQNGLSMLALQGVAAFEIWAETKVPDNISTEACHHLQMHLEKTEKNLIQ